MVKQVTVVLFACDESGCIRHEPDHTVFGCEMPGCKRTVCIDHSATVEVSFTLTNSFHLVTCQQCAKAALQVNAA